MNKQIDKEAYQIIKDNLRDALLTEEEQLIKVNKIHQLLANGITDELVDVLEREHDKLNKARFTIEELKPLVEDDDYCLMVKMLGFED